jgi:hypothetical protein
MSGPGRQGVPWAAGGRPDPHRHHAAHKVINTWLRPTAIAISSLRSLLSTETAKRTARQDLDMSCAWKKASSVTQNGNRVPEEKLRSHLLDMRHAYARKLKLHLLEDRNSTGYSRSVFRSEPCESLSSESTAVLAEGKPAYHLSPIFYPLSWWSTYAR